jgi:hypothetical protein
MGLLGRIFIGSISRSLGFTPLGRFETKMAFYVEHFLEIRDGLIVWPPYMLQHWMHGLRIPLG